MSLLGLDRRLEIRVLDVETIRWYQQTHELIASRISNTSELAADVCSQNNVEHSVLATRGTHKDAGSSLRSVNHACDNWRRSPGLSKTWPTTHFDVAPIPGEVPSQDQILRGLDLQAATSKISSRQKTTLTDKRILRQHQTASICPGQAGVIPIGSKKVSWHQHW